MIFGGTFFMKKKILTILFASVLSTGMLTGCFGNNRTTDNNTTQNDVMDGTTSNIDENNGGTDATNNVNNNDTNTTNNDMDTNGTNGVTNDGVNNDGILNENNAANDNVGTNNGTEDVTAPRDENTTTDNGTRNDTTNLISKKEASEIALSHVKGADSSHLTIHKETEDGETIFEGTITYNNREHHFEIDANSGEILEWDMEKLTR